ncbi:MAG: hypothetical protein OXH63_13315 [Gemmatimonadetes bacterium]|nr:hypothetical protein [Gemmatimonadota bacterium]
MSRWTGDNHIRAVLAAADAWREKCFLKDGSLFGEGSIWTLVAVRDLKQRFTENPIEGTDRTFFDKLKEQLEGAPVQSQQLAAELVWFLLLFPIHSSTKPETKRAQITDVWSWSETDLPESPHLRDEALMGVGHPGTAYLTRRYAQLAFLLQVLDQWKELSEIRRTEILAEESPWQFVAWLDELDGADRHPIRNAILYFLFPDELERNLSNDHKRQIVRAIRHRLPADLRPTNNKPPLMALDRAIHVLRRDFEDELGTKELDFYRPPLYAQWFTGLREAARNEIGNGLKKILSEHGLELKQCGSKKKTLESCKPVDEANGFWRNPADATNKPLRWIVHFEVVDDTVIASVPEEHGSRRIAFANTAQGTSGAVTTRIVPAIRIGNQKFVFYETWEWLLLHCFLPPLSAGSSGQLFDEFDEATGRLVYKGVEQSYIAAALIALNNENDLFIASELLRPLRYSEATTALRTLLNVAPRTIQTAAAGDSRKSVEEEVGSGD